MKVPQDVEWFVWRPVFSTHAGHVAKREIDNDWSVIDLLDCHELIDLHEELDRRATMRAKAASRR